MNFEFESRIRYSECDCEGKLDILGVLNYFQDCSTLESEARGMGAKEFHDRNLVWVLSTWQIEVIKFPKCGDKVFIGTFPYEFKGCFGRRNFYMKDENKDMLAMADTLWTLLDYKEGKPARMTDEIRDMYVLCPKLSMNTERSKIIVPKETALLNEFAVSKRYIDSNMHVNNGQYVRIAFENIINKGFTFLKAEYRKQIRENDIVKVAGLENEDSAIVSIMDENENPATTMEFRIMRNTDD